MKNWKTPLLILITLIIFWFLKYQLNIGLADIEILGVILTVTSVLFGFLTGFFISELWSRYTEVRQLQSMRSSNGLNMIKYAEYFYKNKKFESEFKWLVERSSIIDEIIEWDEGHIEIPFYRKIEDSFDFIKDKEVKSQKDSIYFDNLLDSYHAYSEDTVRLDTLGKERLFFSEWVMIILLSLIITLSVLFLDISSAIYQIIILVFPAIIVLAISIIYDLDSLKWSKETVSLEPNARIFDAIGVKRFYLKSKKKYISPYITNYRTEDDLKGELKKTYQDIINK